MKRRSRASSSRAALSDGAFCLLASILCFLESHAPGDARPDFAVLIFKDRFDFQQTAGWIDHRRNKTDGGWKMQRSRSGADFEIDLLADPERGGGFGFEVADEIAAARVHDAHDRLLNLAGFARLEENLSN